MEVINELIKTSIPYSGILQICLNRPQQLNALNKEVLTQLAKIFQTAKHDDSIKALLLIGEGKGFCAGADIKELLPLDSKQGLAFAHFGQSVFRDLELMGKPSLAAIHGFALGGGCELAMSATLRIATEQSVFGQPEIKLGVIPGFGGTQRLSRLIGKGPALDICLTGKRFSAAQALHWGFLTEVTTDENLMNKAIALLKTLISMPPLALQSITTVIDQGYDLSLEQALELEALHFSLCCDTKDKREGVNAFLEKRAAIFTGE